MLLNPHSRNHPSLFLSALANKLIKCRELVIVGVEFYSNQSAQSIGAFAGPLLGSAIAGFIDYRYVFVGSAILVVFNLINYFTHTKSLAVKN